jgi:hypothetical protein
VLTHKLRAVLQLEAESKEINTETHLKIMAEKEAVSCRRSSCLFPPARPGRL